MSRVGGLLAVAVCCITGSVCAQTYPLRVHASGRYLEDQGGAPFLLNADAAWSLIVQLTYAESDRYLSDRATRGFNGVLVNLVEHRFADNAPANVNNDAPFTGTTFATPNSAYFSHADSVIERARQLGLVVFLCPVYLGYNCGNEGWCSEVQAATAATMKFWGTYVGNRYRNHPNIIWVIGGDTDPTPVRTKVDSMAAGLRAADNVYPNRLITTHSERETQAITHWPESWVSLNNIYTSFSTLWVTADSAYDHRPTLPFFLIEGYYENEHSMTAQQLRAQAYWALLRGGCGQVFGNCPLWALGTSIAGCGTDWQSQLGSPGSVSMSHFGKLFKSRFWHKLVPDRSARVITAGAQSGTTLATVASATDSSSIIGYLPTERTVTINPAVLKGDSIHVWWYKPSDGTVTDAGTHSKESRSYSQPNAGDWVMVIDGKGFNFNPPGNLGPTLVSPADGSTGQPISLFLVWSSRAGAKTYTVHVAEDAGFGSTVLLDSLVADTSRYIAELHSGTTYYWRVRAKGAWGQSPWSTAWTFATLVQAPSAPGLVEPSNGATGQSLGPYLLWNRSAGAVTYDVQLSTDPGFASVTFRDSLLVDTTRQVVGLRSDATYYWRVRSRNTAGTSNWTVAWRFATTLQRPGQVQLVSPPARGLVRSDSVSFRWHTSSPGVTAYWFEWAFDSSFTASRIDSALVDTMALVQSLQAGRTYWWRVRARNQTGWGDFSALRSFSSVISTGDHHSTLPREFSVKQNYPNPFNSASTIVYGLPHTVHVTLDLYNTLGQRIERIIDKVQEAGYHQASVDSRHLSSGVYLYRFQAGDFAQTKKLILLK